MRSWLLGVAASVCLVATAVAADIPVKAPPPPAGFSWLGPYVGINGGYGWWTQRRDVVTREIIGLTGVQTGLGTFGSVEPKGGFGGVTLGVNLWQWGAWMAGLEADGQWADIKDSSFGRVVNFLPGLTADVTTTQRVKAFGTLRGRLGYAWDRTLIYGTAGFAWGRVHFSYFFFDNFNFRGSDHHSSTTPGYAAGGGIEHAFGNLRLKAEYQYVRLHTAHHIAPLIFNIVNATVFQEHTRARTDFHTVRVGLNWAWGG